MIVENGKTQETVALFTADTGRTTWYSLRLFAEIVSGAGATVEIKVNGASIPDQTGAFSVGVDPSAFPKRQASMMVRLENGDVVTADVQGPGTVNLELSGDVPAEQLPET